MGFAETRASTGIRDELCDWAGVHDGPYPDAEHADG